MFMNKNMNMRRKMFKNTGMNMDENMYIVQYTNKNINIFTDGHIVHESMLVNEYLYEHVDTHIQDGYMNTNMHITMYTNMYIKYISSKYPVSL